MEMQLQLQFQIQSFLWVCKSLRTLLALSEGLMISEAPSTDPWISQRLQQQTLGSVVRAYGHGPIPPQEHFIQNHMLIQEKPLPRDLHFL